jgi:hypothetical protein
LVLNTSLQSKFRQVTEQLGADSDTIISQASPANVKPKGQATRSPARKTAPKALKASLRSRKQPETHNTVQMAQRIRALFLKHKISQSSYATKLAGIAQSHLNRMLVHPKPWSTLDATSQRHYLKMLQFFESEEAIQSLRRGPSSTSSKGVAKKAATKQVAKRVSLPGPIEQRDASPSGDAERRLDTKRVAKEVHAKLHEQRISQAVFATNYLKINQVQLSNLMLKPKDWDECSLYNKNLYKLMNKWLAGLGQQ